MKKIYLDMNIYNRPFDDQSQVRIRMESLAIFAILHRIKMRQLRLVWSFILDYENSLNPYEDIRIEIEKLACLASESVIATETIRTMAKEYERKGIKPRDALHLACAIISGATYFITCDDRIVKKQQDLGVSIQLVNPIYFTLQMEEVYYEITE
jgi:predicted nucleic acid-binding protein